MSSAEKAALFSGRCPRCGNEDPSWFYKGSGGWYCRRCISFGRMMVEDERMEAPPVSVSSGAGEYMLKFPLKPAQKKISEQAAGLWHNTDVLLECVCGAGKTEMVLAAIRSALKEGSRVCFAIPRRQVVLEVGERLQEYFTQAKVTAVCGGHTEETEGDLIVCTTHQLYRYTGCPFDLLILDEGDAFPYAGSEVLHGIVENACRGHIIYLTATPDACLKKKCQEGTLKRIVLNERPHHHPIPVPVIRVGPMPLLIVFLLKWLHEHSGKPRMVFVPTIAMASVLSRFLSLFEKCYACTSRSEERDKRIAEFRSRPDGLIVATTVLERGVTISNAQICVVQADHSVFNEASLIQMAGRAGRSFAYPDGDVLFLCRRRSSLVRECRNILQEANHAVSDVRA